MSTTSKRSRIFCSDSFLAIAMCTSIIVWYIVDGHVAGVLVFMFIFIFMEFYFLMKYPRFVVIALISIVSQGGFNASSYVNSCSPSASFDSGIRTGSQEGGSEGELKWAYNLLQSDILRF